MVCSHCQQVGHTYRTCPTITEEEKKEKMKQIKEKKEGVAERRRLREERRRVTQERVLEAQRIARENETFKYDVANTTEYEIVMYWVHNNDNTLRRFTYCNSHSTKTITCIKHQHRIVAFPFLEVCELQSPNAKKEITIPESGELPYVTVFDMKMKDYEGTNIVIDVEYKPKKTEIEQWKECALKSKYLLDQIFRLTGGVDKEGNVSKKEYENIAPMLDMVQDISMPESTELDKEQAGVPSLLTNIT